MKMNRRNFLKKSALASVGFAMPAIVPSSVFGKDAPSNRINIAGIGVGMRGSTNLWYNFVTQFKDIRVVDVCDCYDYKRNETADKINTYYGNKVCKSTADFREVLERKDVDAVVISTHDHWHVPLACYAAAAKKDMYVEKPLSIAMAWVPKLREAISTNNVIFQYGTQQRSLDGFPRVVELVRNGYIGKVKHIDAWCPHVRSEGQYLKEFQEHYKNVEPAQVPEGLDYEQWIGLAPMKPYTISRCTQVGGFHVYDYSLGFIAGWGAHPLDIAQWGLDMDHTSPIRYEGKGQMPPKGLFDTIDSWDVHCEYANGVTMHFMSNDIAKKEMKKMDPKRFAFKDHGTTFYGDEGWISVCREGVYASTKELQRMEINKNEKSVYHSTSHARNFIDCIKSRKPTISFLETAIRSDTISHLSNICVRTGRIIKWDAEKEQIIGDDEAAKMLDRPMRQPWSI